MEKFGDVESQEEDIEVDDYINNVLMKKQPKRFEQD